MRGREQASERECECVPTCVNFEVLARIYDFLLVAKCSNIFSYFTEKNN